MFKEISVDVVTPEILDRIQKNIKTAFDEFAPPPEDPVKDVAATQGSTVYNVKSSDRYLIVNSRGGAVKVVLPTPSRTTQAVQVHKAEGGNPVTVVVANGSFPAITLATGDTAEMVNTGKAWYRFGA